MGLSDVGVPPLYSTSTIARFMGYIITSSYLYLPHGTNCLQVTTLVFQTGIFLLCSFAWGCPEIN